MKEEYQLIYRELFDDYIRNNSHRWIRYFPNSNRFHPPYFFEEASYLFEYTADVILRLKNRFNIREDAMYFLLLNFCEMIIHPILMEGTYMFRKEEELRKISAYDYLMGERRMTPKFDIRDDISNDIEKIVEISSNMNDSNNSISGHRIVSVIGDYWRELRTTRLQIWGE